MSDRIPDDPRIAHCGGQDDVDCPECDGEGTTTYNPNLNPSLFPATAFAECKHCGGTGTRSRESLRAEAREARAEYLADLRRDEDQDR